MQEELVLEPIGFRSADESPMNGVLRQRVLKHLAAISIAVGTGLVDPSTSLLGIPTELMTDIVDEVSGSAKAIWHSEDRKQLLALLASDPRAAVRARVAVAAASLWPDWPDDAQRIVRELASDSSLHVRSAAAKGITSMLRQAAPIHRVELVCQWTVSSSVHDRIAIASALCSPTSVLVTDLAIEQLAGDEDPRVRRLALRAAEQHFYENPTAYRALARQMSDDTNRRVRRAAVRLAHRTVRA